jgi:hypothetical protein
MHVQGALQAEVRIRGTRAPHALIVRSVSRTVPPRWPDREEHPGPFYYRSLRLFAHHDPLACSE